MPEGPEIRIAADRIAKVLVAQEATKIFFAFSSLKPFEEMLQGASVTAVETWGKAMVMRFSNELAIYSHNQLYGRWYVRRRSNYPKTNRELRLAIHTKRHSALLYSASDIEVLAQEGLKEHPFLSKIGPDLLHESTTEEVVYERYSDPAFQRRSLAGLLLHQHFLAGLGNYLRSEILHVCGLHPLHRLKDCSDGQRKELAHETLRLAQQSYETKGITNDLERAEALKAKRVPRRAYRHHVFAREGKPCYVCGTKIRKEDHTNRRVYLCPICQPAP